MCIHHHEFGSRLKKAADAAGAKVYWEHTEKNSITKSNRHMAHIEMARGSKTHYKNAMDFVLDHVGLDHAAAVKMDTTGDYCGDVEILWLC